MRIIGGSSLTGVRVHIVIAFTLGAESGGALFAFIGNLGKGDVLDSTFAFTNIVLAMNRAGGTVTAVLCSSLSAELSCHCCHWHPVAS